MSLMGPPGAIVLLLFTAAVTPGPNNLLMLRIGLESGLHAVLAPATGVVMGGVVMLLLSCVGLARAFAAHPGLRAATTICGAGCVMWLGVRLICRSGASARAPLGSRTGGACGCAGHDGRARQATRRGGGSRRWAVACCGDCRESAARLAQPQTD